MKKEKRKRKDALKALETAIFAPFLSHREDVPGAVIEKLSPSVRENLKNLKSEDVEKLRRIGD